MGDILNFDHSRNEKRKSDFNQRLMSGDFETMKKFMGICSVLDDEDEAIITEKVEKITQAISSEFDLETIKKFDCKLVPIELFSLIAFSSHADTLYNIGEFATEDYDIYIYPYILNLDDGSSIRLLLMDQIADNEFDPDEDFDDED